MSPILRKILAEASAIGCSLTAEDGSPRVSTPKEKRYNARFYRLIELMKENRGEVMKHLGFCPQCSRNTSGEDGERLLGINPFCREVGCPVRYPEENP